ncbi:MAG: MFS transporter [Armatimonadota bacterium]
MRGRLGTSDLLWLSLYWFGLNFHWGALLGIVIPAEVLRFVSDADKGRALSIVFAGGAAIAMLVMPIAGALSDHGRFALGRRRPYMLIGGVLNVAALFLMSGAPSFAAFIAAYWLVQFSNNFGGSAYSGLIPDLVPADQRGIASGWMGLMTMLGTIVGAVATGMLVQRGYRFESYVLIAAVVVVTLALTVWMVREDTPRPAGPLRIGSLLRNLWVNPKEHPDFAWLFASRLVVLMGFYTVYDFAQFFLKDFMRVERFVEATGTLNAVVVAGALASALVGGWLSDRAGRRGIVSGAGVLMASAMLLFLVSPTFELLLILAVVFGLGYGAFVSVDWALATDVLPSKAAAGKDLGIWGIAATLPQVLAPLVGGPLLDAFNRREPNFGYIVLLAAGAGYLLLGSVLVWKIRGVR